MTRDRNVHIIIFDTKGKVILQNRTNAYLLGGKPEDFIGKTIHDIFPDNAQFHLDRFNKIIKEEKVLMIMIA